MIGPLEKGFKAAKVSSPAKTVYEDVDLSVLPKYICFKAALLREKQTIQFVTMCITLLFCTLFLTSRCEVTELSKQLRMKEYILAPGVVDFTNASPQTIPDSYVSDAVTDFISNLGNVNPASINEQYEMVKRFMSDQLKVQFDVDTFDWVEQVKSDDISQIFTVKDKQIITNDDGRFKIEVLGKADFYANKAYLGNENHAIEMELKLMPPESGKRWYLQIEKLTWNKEAAYRSKKKLSK